MNFSRLNFSLAALCVGFFVLLLVMYIMGYRLAKPNVAGNCSLELFDGENHGVWYPVVDCRGLESQCNLLNPLLQPCGNKTSVESVWDCYSGHVQMNCTWYPIQRTCECYI